jgi:hypothetical protein
LAISDHLSWADDPVRHMWLIQEKLNKYLAFVESGEIFDSYPHYRGQPIKIRVVAKYPLTDGAVDFYKKVTPIVESAGFGFEFKLLAD